MYYPWIIHGLSMNNPLVVHGLSMDNPSILYDNPWIIHGLSMDYPWIIHSMDYYMGKTWDETTLWFDPIFSPDMEKMKEGFRRELDFPLQPTPPNPTPAPLPHTQPLQPTTQLHHTHGKPQSPNRKRKTLKKQATLMWMKSSHLKRRATW